MSNWMPLALVRKIEFALLEPQYARADIEAGCTTAMHYDCYAVVVKPHYIELARKLVKEAGIKVISVVGFPHGGVTTASKMYETQDIIQRGADEITMALNIGALRDGDELLVQNDIGTVVRTARGRPVTVALESYLLNPEEKARACQIAEKAGAACIQTSTGFGTVAITADEVWALRNATSRAIVKAAGRIESLDLALELLEAGAARIVAGRLG